MKKLIGGFRECACGCGGMLPRAIRSSAPVGKEIEFIQYHTPKGMNENEKNGMWKGDKVGRNPLHTWVKNRLPKPELCQNCNKAPSVDLANLSGKYLRNLTDWKYLCRSCHVQMDWDNGVRKKVDMSDRVCADCGEDTQLRKGTKNKCWRIGINGEWLCGRCAKRQEWRRKNPTRPTRV